MAQQQPRCDWGGGQQLCANGEATHARSRRVQSFKSAAIASAIIRYSYLDMVSLFELMCNLAAIARYSLI